MGFSRLTCVAAIVLFGCTNKPEPTTPDLDTSNDSDDYSSWFEGMSPSDIADFEAQDDADQLQYPTGEPAPSLGSGSAARSVTTFIEAIPADAGLAIVEDANAGSGSNTGLADAGIDVGSGSDTGPVDAGVNFGSDGGGVTIDAGGITVGIDGGSLSLDAGLHVDAGADAAVCAPAVTAMASATLDAAFNIGVGETYIGTFGPVRQHNIYARGNASGTANLTLAGSITATATSWSATISVSGMAAATAQIHADQELVGPRRSGWFSVGDATLTGNVGFADSVTFTQTCNPPGVTATTQGTQAITANLGVIDARFDGYFFPRLQGPIVTRLRGAIAQFALNFINRRLPGLIQSQVFTANTAYATKKAQLLAALLAKLPPGCGCALAQAAMGSSQ